MYPLVVILEEKKTFYILKFQNVQNADGAWSVGGGTMKAFSACCIEGLSMDGNCSKALAVIQSY